VDEIAKEAGVPKSLIYYHFPSKEAILEALMNTCLAEYQAILHQFFHDPVDSEPEVLLRHVQSGYLKFLETNEDVIRIISMEALKKNRPLRNRSGRIDAAVLACVRRHLRRISPPAGSVKNFKYL